MPALNSAKQEMLMKIVANVPGDFAEIGVFKGATFSTLIPIAVQQKKICHAFDSFKGMDEPGKHDLGQYPKGLLSSGGVVNFIRKMEQVSGFKHKIHFKCFEGYIPKCFAKIPKDQKYSFVYLDVDHYEATKLSLEWCWSKISPKGVLLLDDWFPGKRGLATLAITEWIAAHKGEVIQLNDEHFQLALQKP